MHILYQSVTSDLTPYFVEKKYKKNDMIFNEGDTCRFVGLIVKGSVKITTYTICDQEYVIALLSTNDLFGESLLFAPNPQYMGHIIALEDTTIHFINKKNLLALCQKDVVFLENFLTTLAKKHIATQERVKLLLQKKIKEAILFYLMEQAKILKTHIIPITSKEKLAHMLNVPRPSLSRELITLKKEGWIDYNRYHIILLKKCR